MKKALGAGHKTLRVSRFFMRFCEDYSETVTETAKIDSKKQHSVAEGKEAVALPDRLLIGFQNLFASGESGDKH